MSTVKNGTKKKKSSNSTAKKKPSTSSKSARPATTKNTVKKKSTTSSSKDFEAVQLSASFDDKSTRLLTGISFFVIAILTCVSYFVTEGTLVEWFSYFIKGMLGISYWFVGPCCLLVSWILIFAPKEQRTFRFVCAFLIPIVLSALIHSFQIDSFDAYDFGITTNKLINTGKLLESGGFVGGWCSLLSIKWLGKIPTIILYVCLLVFLVFKSLGAKAESFRQNFDIKDKDNDTINTTASINKAPKTMPKTNIEFSYNPRGGNAYDLSLGDEHVKSTKASRLKDDHLFNDPIKDSNLIKSSTDVLNTNKKQVTIIREDDVVKPEKMSKSELINEVKKVEKEINQHSATNKEVDDNYIFPTYELLNKSNNSGSDSNSIVLETKNRLENTLHSFGINSYVMNITQGPTVTRYDIELEQGVKLSKVTNLTDDIALQLGASNVRIAPITDQVSTVGIEVPNKIVNVVALRDILENNVFINAKSKLTFAIGKDIGGNSIVGNISKLPHMLIAGTTGSGKSVCMNSLIISLLYKSKPSEVKFIMIDPKMVELGIYNSIPHQYVPVVTEPKKAAGALQWAVVEMLKRYRLFSDAGVRDLDTYNEYCINNAEDTLPSVVIVVDELADLMMAASKEVEESICRIAQMGRAAGMHLIIATQRPSSDVITGLMKANIPSRIAFAVSSGMESRIIMDQTGAEKLIGHGDMLYSPIGCGKPLRVQGALVTDEERENVINFIKEKNSNYKQEVNEELKAAMEKADSTDSNSNNNDEKSLFNEFDEMLPNAVEIVLDNDSCSVSMLQRKLKLGYSRAARIVDQMEELSIVGEYQGAKPREVIIDREQWKRIQIKLGLADDDEFSIVRDVIDNNFDDSIIENADNYDEYDDITLNSSDDFNIEDYKIPDLDDE